MHIPETIDPNQKNFTCWDVSVNVAHYACKPFTFAIQIIRNTNQYIESCSFPAKFILRFAFGAAVGCVNFPINKLIIRATMLTIVKVIGIEKLISLHQEYPMYGGRRLDFRSTVIVAPIVEELLFRCVLHYSIKNSTEFAVSFFYPEETARKVGEVTAIIFGSIAFGVVHAVNSGHYITTLPQVIYATLTGIILHCEKEYGGGLTMSIAHHMMHNAMGYARI